MNNISKLATMLGAAIAVLAGCADTPTEKPEFGESVRKVMWMQTYEPNAGLTAGNEAAMGGDGNRLEAVLDVYRGDVAGAEDVAKPVNVTVGPGSR